MSNSGNAPYTKLNIIGKGSYGEVYKGMNTRTGEIIAIKVINLESKDFVDADLSEIQKEVHVLSTITSGSNSVTQQNAAGSEYIVRYRESVLMSFELWIIMDHAGGGSVRNLLEMGPLEEKYIAQITVGVCYALSYLHRIGVVHRDIKSANILLTEDGCVKLCDFGVAGQITARHMKRFSFVGSPFWMAPEVIKRSAYNFKADIWSLGITVYEMAEQVPPYADVDPMKALFLIPRNPPAQLEGDQHSKPLKEFVSACLNDDPELRPTADDLLKLKFVKSQTKRKLPGLSSVTSNNSGSGQNSGANAELAELIVEYRKWKLENQEPDITAGANDSQQPEDGDYDDAQQSQDAQIEPWSFDTIKSTLNRPRNSQQNFESNDKRYETVLQLSQQNSTSSHAVLLDRPERIQSFYEDPDADDTIDPSALIVNNDSVHIEWAQDGIVITRKNPGSHKNISSDEDDNSVNSADSQVTPKRVALTELSRLKSLSGSTDSSQLLVDPNAYSGAGFEDPLRLPSDVVDTTYANLQQIKSPVDYNGIKSPGEYNSSSSHSNSTFSDVKARLPVSIAVDLDKQQQAQQQKSFSTGSPDLSNHLHKFKRQQRQKRGLPSQQNRISSLQVPLKTDTTSSSDHQKYVDTSPMDIRRRILSNSHFVAPQSLLKIEGKDGNNIEYLHALMRDPLIKPPRIEKIQNDDVVKVSEMLQDTFVHGEQWASSLKIILQLQQSQQRS
ncbi:hypothetical protein MIR68_007313 [Amoeboaphelidium protococcarum]|nr:hypothetical protein MIR68_007313 [Amoeboaphelidium protococcarum]